MKSLPKSFIFSSATLLLLTLTACSPSGSSNSTVDPQTSFQEFEKATQDSTDCKINLQTTYDGESYKDYSCEVSCPESKESKDYDTQISSLKKIQTLAQRTLKAQLSTTRQNMATAVNKCVSDQIQSMQQAQAQKDGFVETYNSAVKNLSEVCQITADKITCPEEGSFPEYAQHIDIYSSFIKMTSNGEVRAAIAAEHNVDPDVVNTSLDNFTHDRLQVFQKLSTQSKATEADVQAQIISKCQAPGFTLKVVRESIGEFNFADSTANIKDEMARNVTLQSLKTLVANESDLKFLCDRIDPFGFILGISIMPYPEVNHDFADVNFYQLPENSSPEKLKEFILQQPTKDVLIKARADFNTPEGNGIQCGSSDLTINQCLKAFPQAIEALKQTGPLGDRQGLFISGESSCYLGAEKMILVSQASTTEEMVEQIKKCQLQFESK